MFCAHIRIGNYINKLRATLHMKAYESGHKENTLARSKANELGVEDINLCIAEFNCDPFDPVNNRIQTLHSDQYVYKDLKEDLLSASNDDGKKVTIL